MNKRVPGVLRSLLSVPTAPFREEAVVEQVRRWAAARGLPLRSDEHGNLLIRRRFGRPGAARWVFAAHMDHPGFIVRRSVGRTVWADFRGSVRQECFRGAKVRLFAPAGELVATVRSAGKAKGSPWLACRLELPRPDSVPAGTIGMWDLPPMRVTGSRLASRACDDVVGCAAVLRALEEIVARRVACDVTVLLTRAEEAGFVGVLAACRSGSLPRSARIVTIETSRAMNGTRLGDGVVIRVGDRARVFDPTLTGHLAAVAAKLGKRDRSFRHTRQLMPGGTCESTALSMWGYATAALCIPLGNYHNMADRPASGRRIAAERVDLGDFASLAKLLAALAADRRDPSDTDRALRKRLERILRERGRYLREGPCGR